MAAAILRLRKRHEEDSEAPLDPFWADLQNECEKQLWHPEDVDVNQTTRNQHEVETLDDFVHQMEEKIKNEYSTRTKMAPKGGSHDRSKTGLNLVSQSTFVHGAQRIANSHTFVILCQSAILANAITMGAEVDYGKDNPDVFEICEHVFCVIFLIEMLVKLSTERCDYFKQNWNLLDFSLVVMTILDVWILSAVMDTRDGSLQKMSVLRMMRILRVARMVRFLKVFKELWLIISGIIDSVKTIFWVSVLLALLLYISALLITQVVGQNEDQYSTDFNVEEDHDFNNFLYFGTVSRSMVTLIILVFTADPSDYMRPIAWKQPFMVIFIFLFVMFITFGVMNVIVGVIVDNTIDGVRTIDNEVRFLEQERKCRILKVFKMLFFNHGQRRLWNCRGR